MADQKSRHQSQMRVAGLALLLSGTDQGGQPVRLVMDLRFPAIPNVVRTY